MKLNKYLMVKLANGANNDYIKSTDLISIPHRPGVDPSSDYELVRRKRPDVTARTSTGETVTISAKDYDNILDDLSSKSYSSPERSNAGYPRGILSIMYPYDVPNRGLSLYHENDPNKRLPNITKGLLIGSAGGAGLGYLGGSYLSRKWGWSDPKASTLKRFGNIALKSLGTIGGGALGALGGSIVGGYMDNHDYWSGAAHNRIRDFLLKSKAKNI